MNRDVYVCLRKRRILASIRKLAKSLYNSRQNCLIFVNLTQNTYKFTMYRKTLTCNHRRMLSFLPLGRIHRTFHGTRSGK